MNYSIFYNKEKLGDILFIVFDNEINTTKTIKYAHSIFIYKDDKISGINILNFSSFYKINVNGQIHKASNDLIDKINEIIKDSNFKLDYQNDSSFIVSEIIDIEEHPESEHLHICKVNTNKEIFQVVCGAFNARKGLKCVLAKPYCFMNDGKQIIPNKLLGVESYGMLCSAYELGLIKEHKHGLLELDENYQIGQDFFK